MALRRGSIAFWIKQNNNLPMPVPTEILNTYPSSPFISASFTPSVVKPIPSATRGNVTTLVINGHGLATGEKVRLIGATNNWSTINGDWDITKVDNDTITIPYNSSGAGGPFGGASLLTAGDIRFVYNMDSNAIPRSGTFRTDKFFMPTGAWTHVVWAWTGDTHRVFRNGVLVSTTISDSPFPYNATSPLLAVGVQANGQQDITIDELGSYDYAFTTEEAAALYTTTTPGPQPMLSPHGLTVVPQWGPGERKVKITIDSGNDYSSQLTSVTAEVYRDGTLLARQDFPRLRDGFIEGLLDVSDFSSGTYWVTASGRNGATVVTSSQSDPYVYSKPLWLGNAYGIDDSVPSPYWDPITLSGNQGQTLNVVNRTYRLDGGIGLPVGMTALGKDLLASPIALEIEQGGRLLPIAPLDIQVTGTKPSEVRWVGRGAASDQIDVSVTGRLEYDGMMLLTIRLTPTGPPVPLSGVRLRTTLTSEAAKYVFAVKDQPFWWYTWSVRVPEAVGEFNNNRSNVPRSANTDNIFSVVFSDDDRGLQIFHNNMAGWQIDEKIPWQRFIREANGTVTYRSDLANTAFTLTEPMEVTVGYMATPVKRLPQKWRLAMAGAYGLSRAPQSELEYHFDFNLGLGWDTFGLLTTDLAGYKTLRADPIRRENKRVLPFVNAHVLIPTPPATWAEFNVLRDETLNDGWNSSPSRGEGDYWAWALNRMVNDPAVPNVMDGYYIDESYGYLSNASLLTGAGYIKPDGTHGIGLNLLGAREKYKRLAKILINAGKSPNLWFHTTGTMYPHMWSHGLMTFDGERPDGTSNYYIDSDSGTSPDHFDAWNGNNSLLDVTQSGSGTWLRGISQSRKFGFIPNMWSGIECCDKPFAAKKQKQAQCLYQMHDMIQQDQTGEWWQMKYNFGIHNTDVVFQGYWAHNNIISSDPSVKVSYYRRQNSVLAYIANFGASEWTGLIQLDTIANGYNTIAVVDAENKASVSAIGKSVNIRVGRHECRVMEVLLQ